MCWQKPTWTGLILRLFLRNMILCSGKKSLIFTRTSDSKPKPPINKQPVFERAVFIMMVPKENRKSSENSQLSLSHSVVYLLKEITDPVFYCLLLTAHCLLLHLT